LRHDCKGLVMAARGISLSFNIVIKYRVGQKNQTCLIVDNSAMVTHRKASDISNVLECCSRQ